MSTSVASVVNHFPSAENGFTTTLASTITSGATTVPLNSVAGYTNGEIAVFVVDPEEASKKQTFTGTIDTSGVQVTDVVWTAGTNQVHSGGATVVDYATATHISMISKGILVGHNQAGHHRTLKDTNGNEWIEQVATASAVNQLKITNAATGNAPKVESAGDNTNIDLEIGGKGTGLIKLLGNLNINDKTLRGWDGWLDLSGYTIAYASATSFTVSGVNVTALFPAGAKIKLTQTTAKYFYVTSSSFSTNTTVNVLGGSDYSLANAAITSPFVSYKEAPQGFPQRFNYTPSFANTTLGDGSVAGTFSIGGGYQDFDAVFTLGSTSAVSNNPTVTFPTASPTLLASQPIGICNALDAGVVDCPGLLIWASTTTAIFAAMTTGGTYAQNTGYTSTIPISFGNGDKLFARGRVPLA